MCLAWPCRAWLRAAGEASGGSSRDTWSPRTLLPHGEAVGSCSESHPILQRCLVGSEHPTLGRGDLWPCGGLQRVPTISPRGLRWGGSTGPGRTGLCPRGRRRPGEPRPLQAPLPRQEQRPTQSPCPHPTRLLPCRCPRLQAQQGRGRVPRSPLVHAVWPCTSSQRSEFRSMASPARAQGGAGWGGSLLLQPGGLLSTRGLQLDVELLEGLLQLLLVPSKVGRDGVVKEQKLLVHHLDLGRAGVSVHPPRPTAQHPGMVERGQGVTCPAQGGTGRDQSCCRQPESCCLQRAKGRRTDGRSPALPLAAPSRCTGTAHLQEHLGHGAARPRSPQTGPRDTRAQHSPIWHPAALPTLFSSKNLSLMATSARSFSYLSLWL